MVNKRRTVRVRLSSYDRWTHDADHKILEDYRTLGAVGVRKHHLPERRKRPSRRAPTISARGATSALAPDGENRFRKPRRDPRNSK
jgi:hypothetical protein